MRFLSEFVTFTHVGVIVSEVRSGSPGAGDVPWQADGGVGMVAAWAGFGLIMTATTPVRRMPTAMDRRRPRARPGLDFVASSGIRVPLCRAGRTRQSKAPTPGTDRTVVTESFTPSRASWHSVTGVHLQRGGAGRSRQEQCCERALSIP